LGWGCSGFSVRRNFLRKCIETLFGSYRSLRSHPTLALPYFAGEGTDPDIRNARVTQVQFECLSLPRR